MFNFSANHLFLLSRTEYRSCAVFALTKRLHLAPNRPYCVAGKVNSAGTLYLVIESVKPDTKHQRLSTTPVPADGAGGSPLP